VALCETHIEQIEREVWWKRSPFDPVFATEGVSASVNPAVTSNAYRVLWGSALGYAMDGFDLLILGFKDTK
jgi:hypothetical protein